ncbi:DEAD/DEAH box helicase [Bacillus salitolerans]|uniref:DEAD/DEAH box helicase n=1 Tax=Bacillus salitolerans TaxID=1437434 RepID=A0ABW4LR96_9BACI
MRSTYTYISVWKKAIAMEIQFLREYGSKKYRLIHGQLFSTETGYTYYFESFITIPIPIGSIIKLEWGSAKYEGRILSSEGRNIVVVLEQSIGDLVKEAFLLYDPWELLEELSDRLEEIRNSRKKRARIKKLMNPQMPAKHPVERIKNTVHELLLRSTYNPVTFVWGPPGTGKTYTLARVAANHYSKQKRILLLSQSNQAVDVLISEIYTFLKRKNRFQEGEVIRYGSHTTKWLDHYEGLTTIQLISNHNPSLIKEKDDLLSERNGVKQDLIRSFSKRDSKRLIDLEEKITRIVEKIRLKEIQYVKEAYIIGTTLAKAATDSTIYEREYDLVIVDEASMAYVPQAAFATSLGKRVIICGDFKQLPPIASSRGSLVEEWLRQDIFHKSGVADLVDTGTLHPHLFLLRQQRRMHPEISAFTNQYIYHNLVEDDAHVKQKREGITAKDPFQHHASILLNSSFSCEHCMIETTTKSRINLWHLLLSFQLIHESFVSGIRSIGYVTPYRAQALLMELLLEELYSNERQIADITAATVHKFQGSEKEVVIFDTVDGYPEQRPGMLLTGKDSERLINVAITRTKGKFIHICDTDFFLNKVSRNRTIRQLVDYQLSNNLVVTRTDIGKWIKNQHQRLKWIHAKKTEFAFNDMKRSRKNIIVSLTDAILPMEWIDVLLNRQENVKLTIISGKYPHQIQPDIWVPIEISFPFVIIDHQFLWLGIPLVSTNRLQPPFVACRLQSKPICEQLILQISKKEAD